MGLIVAIIVALSLNTDKIVDPTGGNVQKTQTTVSIVNPTGGN